MTRAALVPAVADRLVKLAGLFGSDHDGERAEAARQADRLVRSLGLAWQDVIVTPPPEWQAMAKACKQHAHELSDRDRQFITNLSKLRRPPSDNQMAWLLDIFERVNSPESLRARGDAW
jgi:hypothetical protein